MSYPATIDVGDGSAPRECSFCDASQEGAQLLVADPASLPDQFILALNADGTARRHCRVIWRRDQQVGVEFVKGPKRTFQPQAPTRFNFLAPDAVEAAERADESEHVEPSDLVTLPPR